MIRIKDKIGAFFLGDSVFEPFIIPNKDYKYRPIGRLFFALLVSTGIIYIVYRIIYPL